MATTANVVSTGLTALLQHTYPDHDWWDVLRYLSALLTSALILANLRIAFGAERPGVAEEVKTIRIGVFCNILAIAPLALTEIASIGQPIVPWRLPLVLAMDFFGWWYVSRRL